MGGFGSRFWQEGVWDRDLEKSTRLEEDAMESEPLAGTKPEAVEGAGGRQGTDGLYLRTRRSHLRAQWWPPRLVLKCRRVPGAPLGPGLLALSLSFLICTVGTSTVTLARQDGPGLSRGSTP
uniref:LOC100126582 protein n=1 Tax=Homo sapiens TaxID=9606 RepID=Q32P50_HUMAN|nr:LOC100126582 protein [Homo sapiens]